MLGKTDGLLLYHFLFLLLLHVVAEHGLVAQRRLLALRYLLTLECIDVHYAPLLVYVSSILASLFLVLDLLVFEHLVSLLFGISLAPESGIIDVIAIKVILGHFEKEVGHLLVSVGAASLTSL